MGEIARLIMKYRKMREDGYEYVFVTTVLRDLETAQWNDRVRRSTTP